MRLDHIILEKELRSLRKQTPKLKRSFSILGSHSGSVTPDPIPNSEVKPSYANDTASLRGGKVGRCQVFFVFSKKTCRKLPTMLYLCRGSRYV